MRSPLRPRRARFLLRHQPMWRSCFLFETLISYLHSSMLAVSCSASLCIFMLERPSLSSACAICCWSPAATASPPTNFCSLSQRCTHAHTCALWPRLRVLRLSTFAQLLTLSCDLIWPAVLLCSALLFLQLVHGINCDVLEDNFNVNWMEQKVRTGWTSAGGEPS